MIKNWKEFCESKFNIENKNESLINKRSLDQLKNIFKISKPYDIGERTKDIYKNSKNLNSIDGLDNVDTYEEWMNQSKKFKPSWNVKGDISPFD